MPRERECEIDTSRAYLVKQQRGIRVYRMPEMNRVVMSPLAKPFVPALSVEYKWSGLLSRCPEIPRSNKSKIRPSAISCR